MSRKRKIGFVFGTRPEIIKLYPVYKALMSDYECVLISTGQQKQLSSQMLDFFEITPDYDLDVMRENQTLSSLSYKILNELENILKRITLDGIIVQGDTSSAFCGALSGFYNEIPVIHIEAGLRSFDLKSPFPEEANRVMISAISTIDFAPTEYALRNLLFQKKKNIYNVGNTVIDALSLIRNIINENKTYYKNKFSHIQLNGLVLITIHRRELKRVNLIEILETIKELALKHNEICFAFPVHFTPRVRKDVIRVLDGLSNVYLIEPLPYDEMIFLMMESVLIMTDSGGIQEEAPTFKKPVIVLRDKTERQEGVDGGIAFLAGYEKKQIIKYFESLIDNGSPAFQKRKFKNPYGDGKASERIKKVIDDFFI